MNPTSSPLPWRQRLLQRARMATFARGHFRLYDLLRAGSLLALLCGEPLRTHAELCDEHVRQVQAMREAPEA